MGLKNSGQSMILRTLALFGVILLVGGAIALPTRAEAQTFLPLPPTEFINRVVSTTSGTSGSLTLREPMVRLDAARATRGIRLPSGDYVLEAEDADYLYYRAPERIEFRIFADGQVQKQGFIPGGIYVSKAFIALVPAGVYQTSDDTHKTLIWKLGADFLRDEGTKWVRTKVTHGETDK